MLPAIAAVMGAVKAVHAASKTPTGQMVIGAIARFTNKDPHVQREGSKMIGEGAGKVVANAYLRRSR